MKNLIVFVLGFALLSIGAAAIFQERAFAAEIPPEVLEAVNLDENILPEDLEVAPPRLLPDSPFYFFKNWWRGIRCFFVFNPLAKARLREKFANEKLMEVKRSIKLEKAPEIIKKAIENYREEIEKIKQEVEKIREKAKESPPVESFLDKFIHHQILHQKLLQRLEAQVPPEVSEKMKEARERHLERFKDVMLKLEDRKEKIAEKLDETLEKQKGSKFKYFKNSEVLMEIEEKMPKEVKEKIIDIREKMGEKLYENLERLSLPEKEQFKGYLKKISGDTLKHLEIMGSLEREELSKNLKDIVKKAKQKKIKRLTRLEEYLKITAEKAQKQIAKAETEIAKAEKVVEKMDPDVYRAKAAVKLLESAKKHLAKAKEAFEEGKYGKAYGLATVAYHQALAVEKIAKRMKQWEQFPQKMKEKFEELYPEIPLPEDISKCKLPARPRCLRGSVKMERTPEGCPVFKCIPFVEWPVKRLKKPLPAEIPEKPKIGIPEKEMPEKPEIEIPEKPEMEKKPKVCYTLWDPVCGVDGKTYSNKCWAAMRGVDVAYKGICKETKRPFKKFKKELFP